MAEVGQGHELDADIHFHIIFLRDAVVPEEHVLCDPVSRRKYVVNAGAVVVGAENRRPGKDSDIILPFGRKDGAFFRVLSGSETKRHGQSVDSIALGLDVGGVFIPDSGIEGFVASDFPVGADSGFEEKAE